MSYTITPFQPAHPTLEQDDYENDSWSTSPGPSFRAELGAKILVALLSNGEAHKYSDHSGHPEKMAELALEYTDAYISVYNKSLEDGK